MGDVLAGIEDDVPFDFAGATELERELRTTATKLDTQIPRRNAYAHDAREEWRGAYSRQFEERMRLCTNDGGRLSAAMQLAANQVKELAEAAQREQDRREAARAWKREQDNKNILEEGADAVAGLFGGGSDKPPVPPPEPPLRFVSPSQSVTGRE